MVTAAPLPGVLVLTDAAATGGRPLAAVVAAAVAGGARAVVLREKHLPRPRRAALAAELRPLLADAGGVLLVASDPTIDADGVHLAADDPLPVPLPTLAGRSCHSAAEVAGARRQGCHYAILSPIHRSPSKPGYGPALGPSALADTALPVWALGGVDPANAAACIAAGAAGVAVMGTVMRAEDPAAVVAALCRAVEEGRGR